MAKAQSENNIAIIGAGHMGTALMDGLVKSGIKKNSIRLGKRGASNMRAVNGARIIFVAVKPSVVDELLSEFKDELKGKVVVSLAAGVTSGYLKKHAKGAHVARIMPNLPVAEGEGVIGFMRGNLSDAEVKVISKLLSGLGVVIKVRTDLELDAITLIAGCGPGVVASFVEALSKNAARYGLTGFRAEQIAFQTFKGTLAYMESRLIPAARLKKAVATKGGVTEAILKDLEKGFEKNLARALDVGGKRIKKIRR